MAGSFALWFWTAWLVVGLCLLGAKRGVPLAAAFILIAFWLTVSGSHAWRPYLMIWLAVHALLSGFHYVKDRNPRRVVSAAISLEGVLWLWVGAGAPYWQYFAGVTLTIAGAIALVWLARGAWVRHGEWVGRKISKAVTAAEQDAAADRDVLLARHKQIVDGLLGQLEERDAELCRVRRGRANQEKLRKQGHDENRALKDQLAAAANQANVQAARAERLQREINDHAEQQRKDEQRRRDADRQTVSDIFCCTACISVWMVTTQPGSRIVRRPFGEGCPVCSGPAGTMRQPAALVDQARGLVTWTPEGAAVLKPAGLISSAPTLIAAIASPSSAPQPLNFDGKVPLELQRLGHLNDRGKIGLKLAVDVMLLDDKAIAADTVQWATDPAWKDVNDALPPGDCRALSAIADALDAVLSGIAEGAARGIALCARVLGAPDFIADLLGELGRRAIAAHLAPLHSIAQGIRVIGTISCASEGADHLAKCPCARGLAKDLSDDLIAHAVDNLLGPAVNKIRALEEAASMPTLTQQHTVVSPHTISPAMPPPSALGPF
jgi:hypothetical protein